MQPKSELLYEETCPQKRANDLKLKASPATPKQQNQQPINWIMFFFLLPATSAPKSYFDKKVFEKKGFITSFTDWFIEIKNYAKG